MKKKISFLILFSFLFSSLVFNQEILTKAEKSNYKETSRYNEVIDFLEKLQQQSSEIKVVSIGKSTEGRDIPLAILGRPVPSSPSQLLLMNKPSVYIQVNIHAGEVEGKEAVLMLMREILLGELNHLLDNQVLLITPNYNPDGNEKIKKTNRSNQVGPEGGVGVRYNGQQLDLNRDYIKLESPENSLAAEYILNKWDPILLIDLHTTNGSYHQEPLTYATAHNPNGNQNLPDYLREKLFPEVCKKLDKKYGIQSIYYGYFVDRTDPTKGWRTVNHQSFYSTNYWGLRNRFSILVENYAYADYKTRIHACNRFVQLVLEYVNKNYEQMLRHVKKADLQTIQRGLSQDTTARFGLEFEVVAFEQPILIHSYEFELFNDSNGRTRTKKLDKLKDYTIPFFGKFNVTKEIMLPKGYLFSSSFKGITQKLKQHGIIVEKLKKTCFFNVQAFQIDEIENKARIYQGHKETKLKGHFKNISKEFSEDTYFVGMDQPLANLISYLLEPESDGGLVRWNFFDRYVHASQWRKEFNQFPVYRLLKPIKVAKEILN